MALRLLTLILTLASLLPATSAQVLDAELRPGDQFSGEIDSADDVDLVRFASVAGAELNLTVAARQSSVRPTIEIVDLSDDSVVISAEPPNAKSRKLVVKKLVLPTTGNYAIVIRGLDESVGGYQLKLSEKLPKALTKQNLLVDVAGGDSLEATFEAADGFELSAVISQGKQSAAEPQPPTLAGPGGVVALGDALTTKAKPQGDVFILDSRALEASGSYTLSVVNGGEESGEIKAKLGVRRQKLPKRKLEELPSGDAEATSLSGTILASNDNLGLAGVVVTVSGGPSAETDAMGNFLIQDPPAGVVQVTIDGSDPIDPPAGASFGVLQVEANVASEGPSQMPQVIVLIDLAGEQTASDTVLVDGLTGVTTEAIDAAPVDASSLVDLSAAAGVEITLAGVPASSPVTLSVTPVAPEDVPMPLAPEGLDADASSYVTIQPASAAFRRQAFDAGALELGLDVVFENDRDLPVGSMVDVWSFDHDANAWVNRSEQTGQQGVVVDNGDGTTQIEAEGVILEGGWHAPVVPVDADCATVIKGRVVSSGAGLPIKGATVATTLGQFASTASDGSFEIRAVPAYEPGGLPGCVVLDDGQGRALDLVVVTPVDYGAQRVVRSVASLEVVPGDCTEVGDIAVDVPTKGSLVVLCQDNGAAVVGASVQLSGPGGTTQHTSGANGQFFVTCLQPGSYIASHTFSGDSTATSVSFLVKANATTTVNLQRTGGAGKKDVTICVVRLSGSDPNQALAPLSGAKVRLVSADSPGGVLGSTNANGKVTFEKVNPPYTVTAQVDKVINGEDGPLVGRFAATVFDITPKTGLITLPLEIGVVGGDSQAPDTTISGVVANLPLFNDPGFAPMDVHVYDSVTGESLSDFIGPGQVDPFSGAYSVDFASTGNPVNMVFREGEFVIFGDPDGDYAEATVTVGALLALDVPDPGPGGEGQVDFDYDELIAFEPVPLLLEHLPSVIDQQSFRTQLLGAGGPPLELGTIEIFNLFEDQPLVPDMFWVPDLSHPALAGASVLASAQMLQTGDESSLDPNIGLGPFVERGSEVSVLLDSLDLSGGLSFSFGEKFVRVLQPAPNDELTLADTASIAAVIDDRSASNAKGFNALFLEGSDLPDDFPVQFVNWVVFSRLGLDELQLPSTTLPMFGLFGSYAIELESINFSSSTLTFDRFFDEAFDEHLPALLAPVAPVRSDFIAQLFEVIED